VTAYYVDTSVLLHAILQDDGGAAHRWLAGLGPSHEVIASAVVRLETIRVFVRQNQDPAPALPYLRHLTLLRIDDQILHEAERLLRPLRSLDAIHLVTALRVPGAVMVTHDARLAAAARAEGLAVLDPVGATGQPR